MSSSLSSSMVSKAVAGNFGIDYPMFIDLLFKDEDVKTLLLNAKKNPKSLLQHRLVIVIVRVVVVPTRRWGSLAKEIIPLAAVRILTVSEAVMRIVSTLILM